MPRAVADIRSLARRHTSLALNTLAGIARQKNAPAAARVSASVALLERGWGKPQQDVVVDAEIKVTIRKMLDDSDVTTIDVTPAPAQIESDA